MRFRTLDKPWLKNYCHGVPAEIEQDKYSSIVELFDWSCSRYEKNIAFNFMESKMTFAQFAVSSAKFCAALQHIFGIKKGDRVAIMLPNCFQYPIALYGVLKAGAVVVNVNPMYTAPELVYQMNDSQADTIIVIENFAHVVAEALPQTQLKNVIVTSIGDLLGFMKGTLVNSVVKHVKKMIPDWHIDNVYRFTDLLHKGKHLDCLPVSIVRADLAFLQYTGGTTGRSKGAMLSHGNILSNVAQGVVWFGSCIEKGHECVVTALPLYHIFALTVCLILYVSIGGCGILIPNPRDKKSFIKALIKNRPTVFVGLNTLFQLLMNDPMFHKVDFSSYKFTITGGMAIQQAVADRWKNLTNITIIEGYGLTETSPLVAINPITTQEYRPTVGLPLPSTEVIIKNSTGDIAQVAEAGEVCVRGPQVMQGYWNKPEETTKAVTDGWFHTGDIGYLDDDGFLFLVDRKKDMVIVSGFNVYPTEIEDVLASMPGVSEVAVIGVPSERSGEAVKAFVVTDEKTITDKDIIAYCRKRLVPYKVPRLIEFRDELPKSNIGKVLRRALRDEQPAVTTSQQAKVTSK